MSSEFITEKQYNKKLIGECAMMAMEISKETETYVSFQYDGFVNTFDLLYASKGSPIADFTRIFCFKEANTDNLEKAVDYLRFLEAAAFDPATYERQERRDEA